MVGLHRGTDRNGGFGPFFFGRGDAETGGGVTILALSQLGIPVSTTHTITGAIFGVGAVRRLTAVRWSVGQSIVIAWVLTLPASAALSAALYYVLRLFVA